MNTTDTTFDLKNDHNQSCNVAWVAPVPPGSSSFTVPAKTTYSVSCSGWPCGTYTYTASCCDALTNPKIIMQ